MNWRGDDRAQSVQIGAILLFATLVIALSVYQATIVPSQNADIEYQHSQTVQNQMADVRNGILRSAATGNAQPVSVTLGTQYPPRVFLLNPPPATGTLQTGEYDNDTVRVSNVAATNGETADFLAENWTASTKYLQYESNYHEYDNAPTLLYEASVLSNFYPNTNGGTAIPLTEQLLVDNETRTITLVALNGSLSTTRASSVTVSPETLSAPYQRVQVTNASDGPVNVSVPTRLSAGQLENRTDLGDHPGVIDVVDVPDENRVVVTVEWTGQFTLQTARVGVGSRTENPDPHYLTLVENRGDRVTVETRDRFNNAESGVEVTTNRTTDVEGDGNQTTGVDGRTTFEVLDGEDGQIQFELMRGNGNTAERTVNVSVDTTSSESEDGNGSEGDLPGGEPVVGSPQQAFDDADDDGELDAGETTYDKSTLYNFNNDSVNLVIPEAVGKLQNQNDPISITAQSITSEVDIRSQNENVDIRATQGEILLGGDVRSDNQQVNIFGKRVDVSGATIRADNNDVTVSATEAGGGELVAVGSTIRSQNNDIILNSVGDMVLDDATIRSQNGEINANLGGAFTLHIDGTSTNGGIILYTPDGVTEDPERPIAEPE